MKILVISKYDIEGGAAIAAYRKHKSLKSIGLSSKMLVHKKIGDDITVEGSKTLKEKFYQMSSFYLDQIPVFFL